jgi:nucleoside-diphosphate-sugar epimerase
MKILITGSKGNVGSVLLPHLLLKGHKVYGLDIVQDIADDFLTCDINSPSDLYPIFHSFKPDLVIHLAAMVSRLTCELSPALTVQSNLSGLTNIVQMCREFRSGMMFFSTSEVYGNIEGDMQEDRQDINPNNLYGLSKLMGELLVKYYLPNAVIVRPFMLYHESETIGDNRSAMIRFVTDLKAGKRVYAHSGSIRSWMHMDDAIEIIERLCHIQSTTVNIGNGDSISAVDLARIICDQLGIDYSNIIETEQPDRMTLIKRGDFSRQQKLTGYKCKIAIQEGIKRLIDYTR